MSEPILVYQLASWPTPNYVNPVSRAKASLVVVGVLLPLAVLIMAGRLYTRIRIVKTVGLDDWLMLMSTILAIPLGVVICVSEKFGWGRHTWDVRPEWHEPGRKIAWTVQLLFILSASCTKISILAFYLRVMNTVRTIRILSWIGVVIVCGACLAFFLTLVLICFPLEAYWIADLKGKCVDSSAANIANASVNVFTDIYVFVIPITSVMKLTLPYRQRITLLLVFSLGLITCIAGIFRIWSSALLDETIDKSWAGSLLYTFSALENLLGIICASIPALKPLLVLYFPRSLSSNSAAGKNVYKFTPHSANGRGGAGRGRRLPPPEFALVSLDPRFDATATIEAGRPHGPGRRNSSSDRSDISIDGLKLEKSQDKRVVGAATLTGNSSEECFAKESNSVYERGPTTRIGKQVRVEVTVEKLQSGPLPQQKMSYGLEEGSPEAERYNRTPPEARR
ncbi:hypothetical protein DFH27DRAFT_233961 [Peziza echinospora]|nr:hypothetical protein DFH27DRAFT_233961 [Peziza echinospora]